MSIDERMAKVQADQYGLITVAEALTAGCSYKALRRRRAAGLLVAVHPGVLASPAAPASFERTVLAAVLGAGVTAFASHETAARLWELPVRGPSRIEVTTVLERRVRLTSVTAHRSGLLIDPDVTQIGAIPVATPERTILDLSSRFDLPTLGGLIDEALRRRLTTCNRIVWMAGRLPPAPGRSPRKVRAVVDRRVPGSEGHESDLEDFVFEALRRFAIPLPLAQYEIVVNGRRLRIDFAYPPRLLALEAKGFEYHGLRSRFDADAMRSNELRLAGWQVLEFTSAFTDWQIATHVARALGRPAPAPPDRALTFTEWKRVR